MTKVYSFDIFDTLLLRPYIDPQELWKVLEEQEGIKGFAVARKESDAKTYKEAIARGGETTIDAAYNLMPKKYATLKAKELELERKVLTPNPEMIEMWHKASEEGCWRAIVSDMYLPLDFITSVLEEKGVSGWDAIYLSSDRGVRKSTGKLFKIMLEEFAVLPEDVLHTGDNTESDVKIPEQLGIKTKHYKKVSERFFELCPFARYIDGRLAGVLALGWHTYSWEHKQNNGEEPTYWNRLGFTMGGVLGYMYVSWIVETAKKLGKKRLLFVARDGYIWKKICNELYPEIETEYIYAPRITSIAVLGAIGNDPIAIKDRKEYIERHLSDKDCDKIDKDYAAYISQYRIDDDSAIVDGCSSGFSAQKLIEKSLGHPVFSFYLSASAPKHNAASLFATDSYTLPFQHFSEFLFSAPENPIKGIQGNVPCYSEFVDEREQLKIDVSEDIKNGAVESARFLYNYSIDNPPSDWISYSNLFTTNLSQEDFEYLQIAKNAGDVNQKNFVSILWTPQPSFLLKIRIISKGHWYICLSAFNRFFEAHVTKHGINRIFRNRTIRYKDVVSN